MVKFFARVVMMCVVCMSILWGIIGAYHGIVYMFKSDQPWWVWTLLFTTLFSLVMGIVFASEEADAERTWEE